ncbi:MAG: 2-oxoglutarate dehydrogenase E1 component [Geobacteraceae bacterium]|nr:2-oxoglutarate dehydrogenase E1 component [Geobacteraceae bacterium]
MPFIQNISPEWIEEEYLRWQESPESVTPEWQRFFEGFDLGRSPGPDGTHPDLPGAMLQSSVQSLIYRYRDLGHLLACTDPLSPCPLSHPLLDLAAFELSEKHLDEHFHIKRFLKETATLREIVQTMQETYCRSVGVEFMYINEPAERQWLIDRMEPVMNRPKPETGRQMRILSRLQQGTLFEEFLHRRFIGQKRFSLEGGESLLVALDAILTHGTDTGLSDAVIGMSHRGRLNVLANILGKPLAAIFSEFEDNDSESISGDGDVKYHKGYSADVARMHLSLAFNPSHLEAVNPVVEGKCRALQDARGIESRKQLLPILVHGDAAFAGQGMVAETLNLSQLEGYSTGGTIHIVLNNQIGFTTLPEDSRSTRYATDIARMLMVPVFHVHGEKPETVDMIARLALEYRQQFGRDVVLEIICYRRHGHNEGDEPGFTQPLMYEEIKSRQPLHLLYAKTLAESGVPEAAIDNMREGYREALERAASGQKPHQQPGSEKIAELLQKPALPEATAVPRDLLETLAKKIFTIPTEFKPHPKMLQLYVKRLETVKNGSGIDWGTAETLAYASLLAEGISVRLSGQDSRRGTFNHRHAVLHDMTRPETFTPLLAAAADNSRFAVYDSMLSENAVLGFEYGYSVTAIDDLTIWEAQFGDFANGAQVIIDQFIAAGESKWERHCGLVMLLPHGYEGNGAEHSSARIERFLSLCAEENLRVATPSTPAQMFHLLRRQIADPRKKPLIVFTPKSLLRSPICVSDLSDLATGSFMPVISDDAVKEPAQVLLCSGKIYYELLEERTKSGRSDVAIVRIEQLYPFCGELLKGALQAEAVAWVQEEPENMGAWPYLRIELTKLLGREPLYIGRPAGAAPANGSHRIHGEEQKRIVAEAFFKK